MTDTRARQRLDRPGTDAADADDADAQPGQASGRGLPEHARKSCAGVTIEHVGKGSIWHIYIVRCADDSLYTGITTDPARRLVEHNGGARGAAYTRGRRPVRLVWQTSATDRADATRRETAIKRLPRPAKERLVAGQNESSA